MTYAVIQDGVVVNLIWLYSGNAADFPDAVPVNDLPVCTGDSYEDGAFYHEGVKLVREDAVVAIRDMQKALETVGVNVNG